MSENLKRAESLFNRIMNQNGASSSSSNGGNGAKNGGGGLKSRDGPRHHNSHNESFTHHGNGNGNGSTNGHHHHHHHKSGYKSYNNNNNGGNHHQKSSLVPNPNIELPKKDPIKTAEETLRKIPANHHILPYCWTIWHHSRAKPKHRDLDELQGNADDTGAATSSSTSSSSASTAAVAAAASAVANSSSNSTSEEANPALAVNSYLQTTNEIQFALVEQAGETTSNIGSLEQMWACLSSVKKKYELPIGTELLIFKSGVNPVWEDPINTKGGRWVFRFSRRPPNNGNHDADTAMNIRRKSSLIWERLILKTLTGSIIPDSTYSEEIQDLLLNDISGLVLSVRKDEDIISIWNSNLNFNKKKINNGEEEDKKNSNSKKLTSFQARRIICDSILRIIRECNMISQGSDSIDTLDSGSNERVYGVSFEYRLHSDNNPPNSGSDKPSGRRYQKLYINKAESVE